MLDITLTPMATMVTPTLIMARDLLMLSPPLRLMLRLTPRLTHGCTTTVLAMLPTLTDMVIMVWAIGTPMLDITLTPMATMVTPTLIMERDLLMLSPPLRLMLRLAPRLTHGCTTTVLAMLPMLDITHTATMLLDAEMATEPPSPVP